MKFWKMSGAGNDFVLLAGGGPRGAAAGRLARRLCDRRLSIGADGLLLVRRARPGVISVGYFNADGSGAFCGNGSRCAALWAFMNGLAPRSFELSTAAGILPAEITGKERVRMRMPDVKKVSLRHPGRWPDGVREVHFLDTGVPHAVVPVVDVGRVDVTALGRLLRRHRAFGRAGANIDFVEVKGGRNREALSAVGAAGAASGRVLVRTYERGVEAETLACGTGITAAAVALVLAGAAGSPVALRSRSGEDFTVSLTPSGPGASGITIEGPARLVFAGEIGTREARC